jgi:hypothetical protein
MTARTRSRNFLVGAAALALLAPLAIVLGFTTSASASVGPRPHEVYMYKVERHVDLSGEYPDNYSGDVYLKCNDGDYALDGMWRVDHVDQANPDSYDGGFDSTAIHNDERDVIFYTSVSFAKDTWLYRFENFADGNAQVKLFLTCIRKRTEVTAGHDHDIVLTGLRTAAVGTGVGDFSSSSGTDVAYDQTWMHDHGYAPVGNTNLECPVGYYAVAPSYDFYDSYNYSTKNWLFRSYVSNDGRSWNWAFLLRDVNPGIHLNVGFRCLRGYVGNTNWGGNHSHQLPISFKPGPTGNPYWDNYLSHGTQEKQYSCDDGFNGAKYQDYKAMVAGWYIFNPFHTWYLGMDPRPKTRAYKFYYDGFGGADRVDLGLMCVKSRTGKQVKPQLAPIL